MAAKFGTPGNDSLTGTVDADYILGFKGDDTLNGLEGNDFFWGGAGNDTIDGGEGSDTIVEIANADLVLTDTSLTGNGSDTLNSVEQAVLIGSGDNNTLDASEFTLGAVTLLGNGGDDTLLGGTASDFLFGGEGNDILNGAGVTNGVNALDTLTGQGGADTFVLGDATSVFYDNPGNPVAGLADSALIADFNAAEDFIQLFGAASDYVWTTLPEETGIVGASIFLDNGNGSYDAFDELIATIQGSSSLDLNASYFVYAGEVV